MSGKSGLAQEKVTPELLLEGIERQVGAYRRLLSLSRQKQEILLEGNVRELAQLLPDEQQALATLQRLEATTEQAAHDYASAQGIPVPLDYRELARTVAEPWRSAIRHQVDELATLAGDLTVLVVSNGELIRRARELIEYTLSQASRAASMETYTSSGLKRRSTLSIEPAAGEVT